MATLFQDPPGVPIGWELERCLGEIATQAQRDPGEVSGTKFFSGLRDASVQFRRTENRDVLLVVIHQRGVFIPGESAAGVVLLSLEGRVLDYLHVGCSSREGRLDPKLVEGSSEGEVVEIRAWDFLESGGPVDATYATQWPEPEGSSRNYRTKSVRMKTCHVSLKGDRLLFQFEDR